MKFKESSKEKMLIAVSLQSQNIIYYLFEKHKGGNKNRKNFLYTYNIRI